MEHKEITEKIIGCAYKVYNQWGSGFLESVYEKCMMIELKSLGLELKAIRKINKIHEVQLVNYLVATRQSLGLLLNFGDEKVEVKRKVKDFEGIK